jgi:mevalonate kinase
MKTFPGKLLLFGEYTVLLGGKALALPLPQFSGTWALGEADKTYPLQEWLHHLNALAEGGELAAPYALDRFTQELAEGLYFESNIPTGYGLGSSGALCAAFYHRYCSSPILPEDTHQQGWLRQQLAQLESHFHGNSSGTDPLICYVQQPMLLERGEAKRVHIPPVKDADFSFFLVDTLQSRQTAPLVQRFHEYCKNDKGFRQEVEQSWLPLSDSAVQQYIKGDREGMGDTIADISQVQFKLLKEWIPKAAQAYWAAGLKNNLYSLKLCGAGGGGFLLGYGRLPLPDLGGLPVKALPKT